MRKSAQTTVLAILLLAAWGRVSAGQGRIYFPSPAPEPVSVGGDAAATAPTPTFPSMPAVPAASVAPGSVMPAPSLSATPGSTVYPAPLPTTPPGGLVTAPAATLQGTIQATPLWDPYGTPGNQTPSLFPQDPYLSPGAGSQLGIALPATRMLQEIRLEEHWFASIQPNKFGMNDVETYATFALPFFFNQQTPLLVTPGFAIHLWDGPLSPADLPPRVYDAYLDAAWNPQPVPWLGAELSARLGVYSDFTQIVSHSVQVRGKGLGVLTFSPSFKVEGGIWYLNRLRFKLLPAGGIVWTPNNDVRFDILFPNPKFTKRIVTIGTTDWRFMLRGEYGGGDWTVKRLSGAIDEVNYNDLRVATGLEFDRTGGVHGMMETGVAFDREILFRTGPPSTFYPTTTVFVGGAIAY